MITGTKEKPSINRQFKIYIADDLQLRIKKQAKVENRSVSNWATTVFLKYLQSTDSEQNKVI